MAEKIAHFSMFKTSEGERRYFAAYEKTLALWPVSIESFDVPTRYGSTHLHTCGPEDAAPLVLLPGQAISSTMWYRNIASLSRDYRVYALDILGDLGKSVSTHAEMKTFDFAAWLGDVFDFLSIERPSVVGLSYGGFIALRLAIDAPRRVNRLVLMAPASLLRMPVQYFFRMGTVLLPIPLRYKQKLFLGTDSPNVLPAVEQMMTTTDFRYRMFLPPVFTDEELRRVKAPTLLLFGDREVVYKPAKAMARAAALIPDLETALIPGAGHALPLDQPEIVNQRVLAFLNGGDWAGE